LAEEQVSPRWNRTTKTVVMLVLLLGLGALAYVFRKIFPPLALACLIAYILTPVVNWISKRTRLPRGLAALVIYLGFATVVVLVVGLLAPLLVRRVAAFQIDVEGTVSSVGDFLNREYTVGGFTLNLSQFYASLQRELVGLLRPAMTQTLSLAVQAVNTGIWLIFIVVISFYLTKDGPKLGAQVEEWVPPQLRHDYRRLRMEITRVWRDFLRGQLLVGLVMGGSVLVVMGAIGLPNVVVLALLAVAMEFLPGVGHTVWGFIAVPIALFRGSVWLPLPPFWFAILVLALDMLLVQVDLNLYIPRIIGRRVHLHPLAVIVGVIIGSILVGVMGIVLAAPIISSLWMVFKYVYCKLFDLNPWPQQEEGKQKKVVGLSAPGWLHAVWERVEERVRKEVEAKEGEK
jgi:predicted PurR-regulated permease PerM